MKVNYDGVSANAIETWLTDTVKLNEHAYFLNSSAQDPSDSKKLVYKESTISDFATNLYIDAIMQPANAATYYYGYIQVTDVINGLTKKATPYTTRTKRFSTRPILLRR